MLARTLTATLVGIEARLVEVEVDLGAGLPYFSIVGLPDSAVRESRDRVRAAIKHAGLEFPARRITVNLAPASLRKAGAGFDMAIALGLLAAQGSLPAADLARGPLLLGELALDGTVKPVPGGLPTALTARQAGIAEVWLPEGCAAEGAAVPGVLVRGVQTLGAAIAHLAGQRTLPAVAGDLAERLAAAAADGDGPDLAEVRGQAHARRALEIAAAGGHNVLLIGPPGAGKTMLARRLPGLLPPLSPDEVLEISAIYSAAGLLGPARPLVTRRPFRAPHHAISAAGLLGGAAPGWQGGTAALRPGEISLAHLGVLFLDEVAEFRPGVLEGLREPLQEGSIRIVRAAGAARFPARFLLVAACNPCPCGRLGDPAQVCRCTPAAVAGYRARLSGPLLDRIDLHVHVPPVELRDLTAETAGEPTAAVRARVLAARARLVAESPPTAAPSLAPIGRLPPDVRALLESAVVRLGLSARAVARVLAVARTIAALEGAPVPTAAHHAEAIAYRSLDRRT